MSNTTTASAKAQLSEYQRKTADYIAEVAAANYDTYRILPSVAVCQAFQESSLGVYNTDENNLWGIKKGGGVEGNRSYNTLYEGVIDYLTILQNKTYYKNVRESKNYTRQLWRILIGGYYGGSKNEYYGLCMDHYNNHGFEKYDIKMWANREKAAKEKRLARKRALREKRRLEKQKKEFTVVYDPTIATNKIKISNGVVKKGSVSIVVQNTVIGRYDVTHGVTGYKIYVNNPNLDGYRVHLQVNEDAVG